MDNTSGLQSAGRNQNLFTRELGAGPPDESVVRFDAVGMRYGRAPEVLSDLSFDLPRGSFHFLTGASGAGKTTLLSLIYMANGPSRGLISLFGHQVSELDRRERAAIRRRIGVVFEDVRLLDHLNVFDNVALPLRLAKKPPKTWREDVAELLSWVGLGERAQAMPAALSGGERKRIALARAIVARPELILADEPTSNVDPQMARRIMRLLTQMTRQGTTVLAASHDVELIAGSRLPVMHLEDGALEIFAGGIG